MRIRPLAVLVVCAALVAGPAAAAHAQGGQSEAPPDCLQPNGSSCVDDSGGGIPSGFVALIVLVGIGGVVFTIWKVSTARRMATEAGLDPGRAGALALLTKDGLDATYIASSLRERPASAPSSAPPPHSAADRLRELEQLRDDGLVTAAEYDARRRAIVESL
jgi:hypothetical protein